MSKKAAAFLILVGLLTLCASAQKKPTKAQKAAQYEYDKALISMRYGLEDESLKYLNQALALDPKHAASYNLLGVLQFRKKNYGEAQGAFQKYLEFKPDDSEAHANLGYVLEAQGQTDKAEEEYKKAVAIDGNGNGCFGLAKLYLEQKKLPEALEYAQKAAAKNSKSAAAHNLLGVVLNQSGKYVEAAASFEKALAITPNDLNLSVNLGVAYINLKEYGKARELLEKILPQVQDATLKDKINEYLKLIKE
jgi:Flp pilus assembly protein TadD